MRACKRTNVGQSMSELQGTEQPAIADAFPLRIGAHGIRASQRKLFGRIEILTGKLIVANAAVDAECDLSAPAPVARGGSPYDVAEVRVAERKLRVETACERANEWVESIKGRTVALPCASSDVNCLPST